MSEIIGGRLSGLRDSRLIRTLGGALAILGLAVLVTALWHEMVAAMRTTEWYWLFAASIPLVIGHWVTALLSATSTRSTAGRRVSMRETYPILAVGGLAKYLPGGIWQFFAQWSQGRAFGLDARQSLRVWAYPTMTLFAVGGAWVCAFALVGPYDFPTWVLVALLMGFLILTVPKVRSAVTLRLFDRDSPPGTVTQWLKEFALATTAVALTSVHGVASVRAIADTAEIGISGAVVAFMGSWVLGFLAVPVPAGLGVREAALTAGLLPWLGAGSGLAIALVSRLASTVADLITGSLGVALSGQNGRPR